MMTASDGSLAVIPDETCCPPTISNGFGVMGAFIQTFSGWGSGVAIDNSQKRTIDLSDGILSIGLTLELAPNTFRASGGVLHMFFPEPGMKMPSFLASAASVNIQFQEIPNLSMRLVYSGGSSQNQMPQCADILPFQTKRLFYYNRPQNRWISFPDTVKITTAGGKESVVATIQPEMVIRNRLVLQVAVAYIFAQSSEDELANAKADLQFANQGFASTLIDMYSESPEDQNYNREICTMAAVERINNSATNRTMPGYVMMGAPLVVQWIRLPTMENSFVRIQAVIPSFPVATPLSMQQFRDEIMPSFLNVTSGQWERLPANCSYDAEKSWNVKCILRPLFFERQGLRVAFANMAIERGSVALALRSAEEAISAAGGSNNNDPDNKMPTTTTADSSNASSSPAIPTAGVAGSIVGAVIFIGIVWCVLRACCGCCKINVTINNNKPSPRDKDQMAPPPPTDPTYPFAIPVSDTHGGEEIPKGMPALQVPSVKDFILQGASSASTRKHSYQPLLTC
jgi:hypothetical protein